MGRGGRAVRRHSVCFPSVACTRSDEAGQSQQCRLAGAPHPLTPRRVLQMAGLAGTSLAKPFVRALCAAEAGIPKGKMVLAWQTNIATRWLDPQQYEGAATPYNFTMALQDSLIKNFQAAAL
jgi:hypothetical protein